MASEAITQLISLKGKKALITGGGRGIGKELVRTLLQAGADVAYISNSLSPEHAEMEQLAEQNGTIVKGYEGNVADSGRVEELLEQIAKEFGPH